MSSQDSNQIGELLEELPDAEPEVLEVVRRLRAFDEYERCDRILEAALEVEPLQALRIERARVQIGMDRPAGAFATVAPLLEGAEPPGDALAVAARAKAESGAWSEAERLLERAEAAGASGRILADAQSRVRRPEFDRPEDAEEFEGAEGESDRTKPPTATVGVDVSAQDRPSEIDGEGDEPTVELDRLDDEIGREGSEPREPIRTPPRTPPNRTGESTDELDRVGIEDREGPETPPEPTDSAAREVRPVERNAAGDAGRDEEATTPAVSSTDEESPTEWEPGDVLRGGPDPEASVPSDLPAAVAESDSGDEGAATPTPRPAPTVSSAESTDELAARRAGTTSGRVARACAAVLSVLGIATAGLWVLVDRERSALQSRLSEVRELQSSDTYEGWRESIRVATEALDESEPGTVGAYLYRYGAPFFAPDSLELREKLDLQRIYAASMVEFRFERCGSREAKSLARGTAGGDGPWSSAAAVYRHLACGRPDEALKTSEEALESYPDAEPVVDARAAALLETHRLGSASELLGDSPDADSGSRYRRLLRARARGDDAPREAIAELADLAKEGDSDYLEARIARLELAAGYGEPGPVVRDAKSVLQGTGERASELQIARLHRVVGRAQVRAGAPAAARGHFDRAMETAPGRADPYLSAIDFELAAESLDRAAELLETAEQKTPATAELAARRARYLFERGSPLAAADALPETGWSPPAATRVRARIALRRGDLKRARAALRELPEGAAISSRARGLETFVQLRADSPDVNAAFEPLEEVRAERPDDADLTVLSSRAHLLAAHRLDTKEGRDHLDRALEAAEVLAGHGSYAGVGHLLACRARLVAGELDRAADRCEEARRKTSASTAAAATSARTALVRGEPDEARSYLDALPESSRESWRAVSARIRTWLASRDYESARAALDSRDRARRLTDHRLLAGRLAFARGDYDEATSELTGAAEASGTPVASGEARLYLAHAHTRLGNHGRAAPLIDEGTDRYRWKRRSWVIFGELRRRQNRPWDSLENLRIAESIENFPPTGPNWRAYLYTELALTWRRLENWNHRRVRTFLDRAGEAGGDDYPGYRFARGRYLAGRWRPDDSEAIASIRRGLRAEPDRCEMVEALEKMFERFDTPAGGRSIPDAADEACRRDDSETSEG